MFLITCGEKLCKNIEIRLRSAKYIETKSKMSFLKIANTCRELVHM